MRLLLEIDGFKFPIQSKVLLLRNLISWIGKRRRCKYVGWSLSSSAKKLSVVWAKFFQHQSRKDFPISWINHHSLQREKEMTSKKLAYKLRSHCDFFLFSHIPEFLSHQIDVDILWNAYLDSLKRCWWRGVQKTRRNVIAITRLWMFLEK